MVSAFIKFFKFTIRNDGQFIDSKLRFKNQQILINKNEQLVYNPRKARRGKARANLGTNLEQSAS